MPEYAQIAKEARKTALRLIYNAQSSHIGSCFSVADILAVLFEKADLKTDKIVLSCGWKAAIFYHFLAEKGFFPKEDLETYCKEGSPYIGLTECAVNGVNYGGGSMGAGLPAAVGYALSKKLKGEEGKVYCVMSDGELAIGTTHEAALIARHHKLDNLVAIVDKNSWQAMGTTKDVLGSNFPSTPLPGWVQTFLIDGHDYGLIEYALMEEHEKPHVIIFDTIKGKGVSFMENNNEFHYRAPNKDEMEKAIQELCLL